MALTETEVEQLRALLSKLEPGFLPKPVFYEFARIGVMPIVELVPLRRTAQGVEVLFLRRDADDPHWPNLLHTAGTVVRATDQPGDLSEPVARLVANELPGVALGKPHFVQNLLHRGNRGVELAHIYYAEVTGDAPVGEFHALDNLPSDVVDTQIPFIQAAAAAFVREA